MPRFRLVTMLADAAKKYRDFYEWLQRRATLLHEFRPPATIVGPIIRVYRLPVQ